MSVPNLFFLFGSDPFAIFQQTQKQVSEFISEHGDHNFEKFWGDDLDSAKSLLSSLETIPFLGDHRMVLLKNPWDTRKSKFRAELADFLKAGKLPASTFFLISESTKPDKRESLFKFLSKNSQVTEFPAPTTLSLSKTATDFFTSQNLKSDSRIISHLVSRVGLDSFRLHSELQKLSILLSSDPNSSLSIELIDELVPPSDPTSNIFALTDALGGKNLKNSLSEFHSLLQSGSHPLQILATLTTHFRTLLLVSDFMNKNPKLAPKAASELKLHPFVAKKALAQVRNFTLPELKQIFLQLADLDFALKSSEQNADQELENLFLQICQKS